MPVMQPISSAPFSLPKLLRWTLLPILLAILLYLLLALTLSFLPINCSQKACEEEATFYLSGSRIHVNFIFPAESLDSAFSELINSKEKPQYLGFGWGDKDFYLDNPHWEDVTFGEGLQALFNSRASILQVTHYRGRPRAGEWVEMKVCAHQYRKLQQYVASFLQKDALGNLTRYPSPAYGSRTQFYAAGGQYSFINTCNTWVNTGLKRAGICTSVWSPLPQGVFYFARKGK